MAPPLYSAPPKGAPPAKVAPPLGGDLPKTYPPVLNHPKGVPPSPVPPAKMAPPLQAPRPPLPPTKSINPKLDRDRRTVSITPAGPTAQNPTSFFNNPLRPSVLHAQPTSNTPPVLIAGAGEHIPPAPSSSVFVSVGFGSGISHWRCPPPQHFSSCFNWDPCRYQDPFWRRPWSCGRRYWDCDPWGGWYVRSWRCWPDWWWYPSYYSRHYRCGTFSYVRYCRPTAPWCFSFCNTPCITPSCSTLTFYNAYEPAPLCWSTNGYYKFGWVHGPTVTVLNPDPVENAIYASSAPLPQPLTSEDLRTTTDRELGDIYLHLADLDSAVRVYADHIARYPGDAEAVRSYGVALIEADRAPQGVEQIERAYQIDPSLAQRPFRTALLADRARIDRVIDAAARAAASDNSARNWLTLAVLMQADGRIAPARSALDKAKAAGLNSSTLEWMQAALPAGQQ